MITYLVGDATEPTGEGEKIIAHICNDIGAWGRGFVLSLSKKWPRVELVYRRWYQEQEELLVYAGQEDIFAEAGTSTPDAKIGMRLELGATVYVPVEGTHYTHRTWVANMIAQSGIMNKGSVPPIRYQALETCLRDVATMAKRLSASVHMPRIGCGLAGGEWSKVEEIINRMMPDVNVYVYDFDTKDARTIPWKK